ncbi:MAG: hypothetical protein WKF67_03855 [Rubrobacteraceae bacterium]|jgi:hypothetical protein
MERRILPRLGAVCGILYVVLILVGDSVTVGLPLVGDSVTVGLPMELAGMILFVPFLGYLWSVLRQAEGEGGWLSATAFGAGLMGITIKFASIAPVLAVNNMEEGTPLYRSMELMNGASFNLSMFPFAVLAAAVAIVTLKTRVLPAWIGWIGAVTVPALLVNAMFFYAEFIPAFLLFLLWVILLSAVLTWRAGSAHVETSTSISPEPARVR